MNRIAFVLHVKPELLDEYLDRHSPVWPEMLAELDAAGRRNYSLYLGGHGQLFGYYETDDDEAAQAYLSDSAVATRWEADMARFFTDLTGRADQAAVRLDEVFNLDAQLAATRFEHTTDNVRTDAQ